MSNTAEAREFRNMSVVYKKVYDYNKEQLRLVRSLCPFQRGEIIELNTHMKYFTENMGITVGSPAVVIQNDYNREQGYILKVCFDCLPKRYFWMPSRLFRSSGWETLENTLVRKVEFADLVITEKSGEFSCVISKGEEVLATFSSGTQDSCRKIADMFYRSLRLENLRVAKTIRPEEHLG